MAHDSECGIPRGLAGRIVEEDKPGFSAVSIGIEGIATRVDFRGEGRGPGSDLLGRGNLLEAELATERMIAQGVQAREE